MLAALKNLDDVTWADLSEQGRALIVAPGPPAAPALPQAPEWTDHNASDPGITLLDLFAYIAEQDIYRINRVPERFRRLLLALCGFHPRSARAARVLLKFTPTAGALAIRESTLCNLGYRTVRSITAAAADVVEIKSMVEDRWMNLSWAIQRGDAPLLFGVEAKAGAAAYFGFSEAPGAGPVSLGFLWAGSRTGEAERRRIGDEPHHDVHLVWEAPVAGGAWRRVNVEDRTRSLTLNGTVTVDIPVDAAPRVVDAGDARIWLRCRIASGTYDRPPRLVQCFANAVEAEQAVQVAQPLGASSGDPHQRFRLPVAFALADGMRLYTMESNRVDWQRRNDLVASGPADAHFQLDDQRNDVVFGDGARGRLAPFGAACMIEYLATQGASGEASAGAVNRIETAGIAATVTNPGAAEGGADPETTDQASGRAIEALEAATRAMTAADIRDLCLQLSGTLVARAEVIPNHLPGLAGVRATGIITVVIVPAGEGPRPSPSVGLLAALSSYLDARRVVGTRIIATAPDYIEVGVNVTVKALSGADPAKVRQAVESALTTFLDPLRGGEEGKGWPLRRDVYRAEVLQLLDNTPGVDHVLSLALVANGGEPMCGNLCLPATGLTTPGRHQIEVTLK